MAEETKVKITLLSGVVLGPGEDGQAGEIVEVSPDVARSLVGAGQATINDEDDSEDDGERKPANGRRKKTE